MMKLRQHTATNMELWKKQEKIRFCGAFATRSQSTNAKSFHNLAVNGCIEPLLIELGES